MLNKRYKITVEESCEEEVTAGNTWEQGAGQKGEGDWGYTPQIKKIQQVTRTIYMQDVDTLTLSKVVEAVNYVSRPQPNTLGRVRHKAPQSLTTVTPIAGADFGN